jgi:hypothetical protein
MARSKQTAVKSAERQKIAKKSASNTKAPKKKPHTSKREGYVSPSKIQLDYGSMEVVVGERNLVEGWKEFCLLTPEYHRSGRFGYINAGNTTTPDSPNSTVASSRRAVRGSYDQAPE